MAFPERHRRLASALPEPQPPLVADLGCGDGRTLVALRERFGPDLELVGVERREPELDAVAGRRPEGADDRREPQQAAAVRGRLARRRGLPRHARGAALGRRVPDRGGPRAGAGRAPAALAQGLRHDGLQLVRPGADAPARARLRGHAGGLDGLGRRHDRPQAAGDRTALAVRARRDAGVGRARHRLRGGRAGRPRRAGHRRRGPARPPPRARVADRGVGRRPARARGARRVPVQRQRLRRAAAPAACSRRW